MLPLGQSISGLWDIIRPLQYLSMIALVPIIYPANLYLFFFNMIDISSLDIFYGYTITEYLFDIKAGQAPFSAHMEEFTVDTTAYLLNSSSIIIPLLPVLIMQNIFLVFILKIVR